MNGAITVRRLATSPLVIRAALIITITLFIGLFGNRHYVQTDLTATGRHTLLPQSRQVLDLFASAQTTNASRSIDASINVEVYISPDDEQRTYIERLLEKYARYKSDFNIRFVDPALDPAKTRSLNIAPGGEIIFRHQNRVQRITQVSEIAVTSALQRLARDKTRVATFVTGHGERSADSQNGGDAGIISSQLAASGFEIRTATLTDRQQLIVDDGLLVIASPMHRYLPGETAMLLDYLSRGGNLLWLTEPDTDDGLKAIALELGIRRLPGVVVDLATQNLSVERPDFAIANTYSPHQATKDLASVTLFPQAAGLDLQPNREWRAAALVQAGEHAWTETGALTGEVSFDEGGDEVAGPFPLIIALERNKAGRSQRVVVAGDGDFLADAWIGNGGNRDLASRLFNWATDDAAMISIDYPKKPDAQISLSAGKVLALALFSLLLLPGLMFAGATRVWYTRKYG
jgi:ABC-type uncharacterized transport system involved in gliding motility auxiliary subunit